MEGMGKPREDVLTPTIGIYTGRGANSHAGASTQSVDVETKKATNKDG